MNAISREGLLGRYNWGALGCHNGWRPTLALSKQGPGMLEALWCVRLSHVMKNRPTLNAGSIGCEKHCSGLGCLALLDADTVRTGGGVGGGSVRE